MTAFPRPAANELAASPLSEEVWRCHERWLRTVLYARLREVSAVEDVLQETALALVKSWATLCEELQPQTMERFGPWLYRVAIRQALLYRRRLGRQRNLTLRYAERVDQTEQGRAGGPPEWLLSLERMKMVRSGLERLPPLDAQILLLKYTEDWSYQQIADHLGLSHAAVESRLHRARAKLREVLSL
jgi:RNA polymerase sigma factor (sigma-70 family)